MTQLAHDRHPVMWIVIRIFCVCVFVCAVINNRESIVDYPKFPNVDATFLANVLFHPYLNVCGVAKRVLTNAPTHEPKGTRTLALAYACYVNM